MMVSEKILIGICVITVLLTVALVTFSIYTLYKVMTRGGYE